MNATKAENPHAYDVLIVGAGHAGAQAAIALRQAGFVGSVCLLGDEPDLPYERPPMSKDYLAGARPFHTILLRPAGFWAEHLVTLLPGRRVSAVDGSAHHVTLEGGGTIAYRWMIWATGATPRRIPLPDPAPRGVHSVRSRADVDAITAELAMVDRVVVVGGGYVGLETAAVLTKLGKRVTILEAQDRVLARVAGEPISRFFEAEHRRHGVDVRTATAVDQVQVTNGAVSGVRCTDGESIACELMIVGIGVQPSVEPLRTAGALGNNGVDVDRCCRTSLPDVFAIGDCAAQANDFAEGATIRVESLQNANDQANAVARTLCGDTATPAASVPRFWSNQYDLRLQTVGLSTGHDQTVTRGDPADRSFSVLYLKASQVIALDCVNATRDYVQGRALILNKIRPEIARLADWTRPLKELVAS